MTSRKGIFCVLALGVALLPGCGDPATTAAIVGTGLGAAVATWQHQRGAADHPPAATSETTAVPPVAVAVAEAVGKASGVPGGGKIAVGVVFFLAALARYVTRKRKGGSA